MGPATEESAAARTALFALGRDRGIPVSDEQASQLLAFTTLLLEWNARINLTGAKSVAALVGEHLPDAFAVASLLDGPGRVLDVGSGGGLPAIPLAVLRPALQVRLVEPLAKKVAFLRTAVRALGLGGSVAVDPRRAEELIGSADAGVDVALSRATFAPAEWLELGRKLVRPGGRVLVLTVPQTDLPGRRFLYQDGRRLLIQVDCPNGGPG